MDNRIAGGANTASKALGRFPENYPKEFYRGKGAYVWDVKGNCYLDLCCSLGPVILGYCFDAVDDVVAETIREVGTSFSLPHPKERILANILAEMIPCAEMTRLVHNGKDATEAAVRLARHITGRELVLSFSYHGAADTFMACTGADKGVPQCLKTTIAEFDYNDFKRVEELFDKHEIACVIMEAHTIRPPEEWRGLLHFLHFIRDITEKKGALLVFDEVVTFPRYPSFSAQSYFGVVSDLACISKGMANGYPIAALVGKEQYMEELKDGGVFVSTTFGGSLVGVSAAIATLEFIRNRNVPRRLMKLGKALRERLKKNKHLKLKGYLWRQFFDCTDEVRQKVWQEMIKEGVFFHVPIFFSYSMSIEEMEQTADKLNDVLARLDDVVLEGRATSEVFRKV